MPVYNAEAYLREAVDSILAQTFSDFELLCIDDGSSDHSQEILREYAGKHSNITVLSQSNKGAGAARNKGASVASGDYYIFLDADDFFDKEFFGKMITAIKANNADLCVCMARHYNMMQQEYGEVFGVDAGNLPQDEPFSATNIPDRIFNAFVAAPWNKMVSAQFYKDKKLCFQEIMRANDMYYSYTALALAKRVCTIREPLVSYRTGMNTNAQATNNEHPSDFYKALRKTQERLLEEGLYTAFEKSFLNEALTHCVYNLDTIEGQSGQELLYGMMKNEIAPHFGFTERPDDYYYNTMALDSMKIIMDMDFDQYRCYRIGVIKNYNDYLIGRCEKLEKQNKELSAKCKRVESRLNSFKRRKIYKFAMAFSHFRGLFGIKR
ncbi:MAG: glycosyltransferase [Clostridiales Family XIII bacterium]|jgi:glycosyltransferase involved in cell wall biosynthesis|nr:glycosyltransferase [Clostridiales Family XIII bacterium]